MMQAAENPIPHLNSRNLALAGMGLMALSLCLSPALLSIGTILCGASILFAGNPKHWLARLWENKGASLLPVLVFVLALLSFFQTEEKGQWLDFIRIKAPFLVLPVALAAAGPFSSGQVTFIRKIFVLSATSVAILSSVNYFLHAEEINQLILHSKPVPVIPTQSHIYFSVMLSFSVILAAADIMGSTSKAWRYGMMFCVLVGFFSLHLLSARTGLMAFYAAVSVSAVAYLGRQRKWKWIAALLTGMMLLPVLAYYTLPTFRLRVENSREDVRQSAANENPNYYSLRTRIEAWKASWSLFTQKPMTGWGGPEIERHMIRAFDENQSHLLLENMITPHNQYLENLAAGGLISFLVLMGMLILPWFSPRLREEPLFLSFSVLIAISFLVESLLERQVGIAFFLLMREIFLRTAPASSRIQD